MKTLLKRGVLPEDKPTPRWIGECHHCNAIYSGTVADIVSKDDDDKDVLDRDCNFCGAINGVNYFSEGTTLADEILAKVQT